MPTPETQPTASNPEQPRLPLTTPEVQNKVKQALAKLNTELASLKQQVEQAQKGIKVDVAAQRGKTAVAIEQVRKADLQQYQKIAKSFNAALNATLHDESTVADITAAIERGEKNLKALTSLAVDVGGSYPTPSPNAAQEQGVGRTSSGISGFIDKFFEGPNGKMFREKLGIDAEQAKAMIADFLASFRSDPNKPPGFIENFARSVGRDMHFQRALRMYSGNPTDPTRIREVPTEWKQDWVKRHTAWIAAGSQGDMPLIQDPQISAKVYEQERDEKNQQEQAKNDAEEAAKAKKVAADDLAASRIIEGRNIPGDGQPINTATTIQPMIIGDNTVNIRQNENGDFQIKVQVNGTERHENWINIVTSTRPNAMRLCAPRNTPTLGGLRLVTRTPDGTQAFWKTTEPLALTNIISQIVARGAQLPLSVVLADDNSRVTILNPAEVKKKEADAKANQPQAAVKAGAGEVQAKAKASAPGSEKLAGEAKGKAQEEAKEKAEKAKLDAEASA